MNFLISLFHLLGRQNGSHVSVIGRCWSRKIGSFSQSPFDAGQNSFSISTSKASAICLRLRMVMLRLPDSMLARALRLNFAFSAKMLT